MLNMWCDKKTLKKKKRNTLTKVLIQCMKILLYYKEKKELEASTCELQWCIPLSECERRSIANYRLQLPSPLCLDLVVFILIYCKAPHLWFFLHQMDIVSPSQHHEEHWNPCSHSHFFVAYDYPLQGLCPKVSPT